MSDHHHHESNACSVDESLPSPRKRRGPHNHRNNTTNKHQRKVAAVPHNQRGNDRRIKAKTGSRPRDVSAMDDEEEDDDERKPAAAASASTAAAAAAAEFDTGGLVEVLDESPHDWLLQCEKVENGKHQSLWWFSPAPPTKLSQEEDVLPKLLRWNNKERGMMKSQPPWRKEEIQRLCRKARIPLAQALSLRRHHIKRLNPYKRMPALGLGQEDDIRESARLFEEAVADCLKRQGVAFYSEEDQKRHNDRQNKGPAPATPDFLLKREIVIKQYYKDRRRRGRKQQQQQQQNRIVHQGMVNWIEAKMFYGASSIPEDNVSAVGRILQTARKYTSYFGPGAFLFMYGCGDRLARDLAKIGVMALDCSGDDMLSLQAVHAHQRTWCADADGNILP